MTAAVITSTPAEFTRTGADKITWLCSACGRPIARGTGYLACDFSTALRRHDSFTRAVREATAGMGPFIEASRLPSHPPLVLWLPFHRRCDPEPDAPDYWIAVERIDTCARMLHWTAHLLTKRWLDATDWGGLCRRVGDA